MILIIIKKNILSLSVAYKKIKMYQKIIVLHPNTANEEDYVSFCTLCLY